jgi:nitrogen-specific signal transduction histidine kinase
MSAVVKAMKALSRASVRAEPTDLHELIELTASLAKGEWRYVAELELDFDWSLPTLALRQAELAHVLLDMIANAAHAIAGSQASASADKGKIVITTKSLGERLEIHVTDTAGGGPEPLRTRSFEPFFAGDANEGSATGLEFAEAVVRAHGGALRLEADASRFSYVISLPLGAS